MQWRTLPDWASPAAVLTSHSTQWSQCCLQIPYKSGELFLHKLFLHPEARQKDGETMRTWGGKGGSYSSLVEASRHPKIKDPNTIAVKAAGVGATQA